MVEKLKSTMHNKQNSIKSEWSNLLHDKILLISVAVMSIIPILYGGFFLGSIWDPYGKTEDLPIAVVNEDTGATMNGRGINVGRDTVEQLKNNHDMQWNFVSNEQAQAGLDDGKYYMKVVLPKDFSSNAATVTAQKPRKSTLIYTTTPSRNYIGSLLTNQAAEKVAENVSKKISKSYVKVVLGKVAELGLGLDEAAKGADKLSAGSVNLADGLNIYAAGVSSAHRGAKSLETGLSQLSDGSEILQNGLAQLNSNLPSGNQIRELSSGVEKIQAGVNALNTEVLAGNPQLQDVSNSISARANLLAVSLRELAATIEGQPSATECASYIASTNVSFAKAECQLALLEQKSTQTPVTTDDISAIKNSIISLHQTQAAALQKVNSSAAVLNADLQNLQSGIDAQQIKLKDGVGALSGGVNELAPYVTQSLNGYTRISSGVTQLSSGAAALSSGLSTAYNGSQSLVQGMSQLDVNSAKLIDGALQLSNGSAALGSSLAAAANQLSLQPTSSQTAQQIVSPVDADHKIQGEVPNYGYALSPYVLSLGLYVGALAFSVIYPVRKYFGNSRRASSRWFAKMSIAALEAVAQALVLDAIMVFVLGLHPANPWQFVGLSIATSLTFMSIILLLAIALDNVGRFLAMLILVLQLGAAEGVFPLSLSPEFFQIINPFLPMTYSIRAFREAISAGLGSSTFWDNLWILLAFMLAANLILLLYFKLRSKFQHAAPLK